MCRRALSKVSFFRPRGASSKLPGRVLFVVAVSFMTNTALFSTLDIMVLALIAADYGGAAAPKGARPKFAPLIPTSGERTAVDPATL